MFGWKRSWPVFGNGLRGSGGGIGEGARISGFLGNNWGGLPGKIFFSPVNLNIWPLNLLFDAGLGIFLFWRSHNSIKSQKLTLLRIPAA